MGAASGEGTEVEVVVATVVLLLVLEAKEPLSEAEMLLD